MVLNRKIKNATPIEIDGIKFRSKLESRIAKLLSDENITYQYEPFKIQYIPKFKYLGTTYRAAYYTPDFVIDNKFIIECKGWQNDVWRYKKKLVLLQLINQNYKYDFYEINTITQMKNWIKSYKDGTIKKYQESIEISS